MPCTHCSSPALQLSPADCGCPNARSHVTKSFASMAIAMVLTIFSSGCSRLSSYSETKDSNEASASPQFESMARSVNLGLLNSNERANFAFRVLNTSSESFKIISAQKNCSCTEVELEIGQITYPNCILEIPLKLTADLVGTRSGVVLIKTDSSLQEFREIQLTLTAEFPIPCWSEPESLQFNTGRSTQTRRLRLASNYPEFLQSFDDVSCPEFLTVQIVKRTSEHIDLDFLLDERKLDSNWAYGLVAFRFNDNRQPVFRVVVKCESSE
jgi:hypothetical protein